MIAWPFKTMAVLQNMTVYLEIVDGYEDVINIGTPIVELGDSYVCFDKKSVNVKKIKSKSGNSVGSIQFTLLNLLNTDHTRTLS